MYCRGEDTRRQIVQDYEVVPVVHVQLLKWQTRRSCTGDELTDAYYCFSYKSRSGADEGTILCGKHAAKDFLQLINHHELPLFNPIKLIGSGEPPASSAMPQGSRIQWDATAKQLYNAIHLLIICWSSSPGPALAFIKAKLEKFPDRPPFPSQIKAINTILGKYINKRTLTQMVVEISKGNSIKTYNFNLLDNVLAAENTVSNFT